MRTLIFLLIAFCSFGQGDGEFITYYDNGQLKEKGSVKNGLKEGEWISYHLNGQIEERGNYVNNLKEGEWVAYNSKGILILKGSFIHGKPDGEWERYHRFDGDITHKGTYVNGLPEGEWFFYTDTDYLKERGNFVNGLKNGEWTRYSSNGQIEEKGTYVNGLMEGEWVEYDDKGQKIISRIFYVAGEAIENDNNNPKTDLVPEAAETPQSQSGGVQNNQNKTTNSTAVHTFIEEEASPAPEAVPTTKSQSGGVQNNQNKSTNSVYTFVDEEALYPGGYSALLSFVKIKLIYPAVARETGIQGKCFVKFVIDEKGQLSNVEIEKGIPGCPECDREAVRVVKLMPSWIPAKVNGKNVSSLYRLPVNFTLEN